MKRFFTQLGIFAMIPAAFILFAYHTGSPGGRTGSPGDNGNTCTGCHTGTATSQLGWISTDIPPEGYIPGNTYIITASGTHSGVVRFGFELTAEDGFGNKVGALSILETGRTQLVNAGNSVTHTSGGIMPDGNNNTWTMEWTAPDPGAGQVGLYAAFNAANGNGTTSGDVIYTSQLFVDEASEAMLTNVSPDNGGQGEMLTLTITGENTSFTGNQPEVDLIYSGDPGEIVPGTNVVILSDTELVADFEIPFSASTGNWDMLVGDLLLENAFEVYSTVGMDELAGLESIKIYPNPASDHVNIRNEENAVISIFDMHGKLLYELGTGSFTRLSLTHFEKGVYLVRMEKKGFSLTKKLLVQ